MKYRKTKARRNRPYSWGGGNSKSKNFAFTRNMRYNLANAKEYYFDLYEYQCVER